MHAIDVIQIGAPAGRASGSKKPAPPPAPARQRFEDMLRQAGRSKEEPRPAQDRTPAKQVRSSAEGALAGKPAKSVRAAESQEASPQEETIPEAMAPAGSEAASGAGAHLAMMALLLGQPVSETVVMTSTEATAIGATATGATAAGTAATLVTAAGAPALLMDPLAARGVSTQMALPVHAGAVLTEAGLTGQQQMPADSMGNNTSAQLEAFAAQAMALVKGEGRQEPVPLNPVASGESAQPTFGQIVDMVVRAGGSETQSSLLSDQGAEPEVLVGTSQQARDPVRTQESMVQPFSAVMQETQAGAPGAPLDEAPSLRHVQPEPVVRQVVQFARVLVREGRSEANLQLHPEHLGQIQIKLVVSEGVVKAHLHVTDQAVKAALESNLEQFKTRMAEQGMQVEHVQVSVGAGNHHHGEGRGHQFQPGQSRHPVPDGPSYADDEGADDPTMARPEPSLSLRRSVGSRLNSLA